MVPRNILFLALAFTMVLAVVADGDYGNGGSYGQGNGGSYGQGKEGSYGHGSEGSYRSPHYTALTISSSYRKGVIVGKVPGLCHHYGAYWDQCDDDHYFQTNGVNPGYNSFYLRFTASSGNSKGYSYRGDNYQSCNEAQDSVAVEYQTEGSSKWKVIVVLKPDSYRTPKTASYKVRLYGNPCKVTFRFRSLNDCQYDNDNDHGVWSFADLQLVTYCSNNYGNDGSDHGNYGGYGDNGRDHDYGSNYGGNYGGDRDHDDDDHHGSNGNYGDDRDCD